jgi:hypothetical protein
MRKLRGENVYPVIMLSSKSMKTKSGIKQRPDFEIVDWRTLGGSAPAIAPAPVNMLPGGACQASRQNPAITLLPNIGAYSS